MIKVESLIKNYGSFCALNNLSFNIDSGEIIGLLGPNGAGKTTLMRIITGFLQASYGDVEVGGYNIFNNPKEVKEMLGYLPENSPLYPEMTVKEYLVFMAKIRGVNKKNINDRLGYVLTATKIEDKLNSIISTLSKGYKQRVGLAQSLIHDPKVLILDEPTVGLDPAQIIEIRDLINKLKENRTIILSSHILSEVSQVCQRIIILSDGKIVANGTESELLSSISKEHIVNIKVSDNDKAINIIKGIDGVINVNVNKHNGIEVECQKDSDIRANLAKEIVNNNIDLLELKRTKTTLEELFINLIQ